MAALVTRRATRQGEGGMDDAVIVLLSIAATLVGFAGFMFICINCCHNEPASGSDNMRGGRRGAGA